MKKSLVLLIVILLAGNCVLARDYAKLHMKEMQHAQKYSTAKTYVNADKGDKSTKTSSLKDPKLLNFGDYEKISKTKMNEKLKQDEKIYSKYSQELIEQTKPYKRAVNGGDLYQVYRIAEKIIRANNLDYINWRIGIYKDTESPNAYSTNVNYIALSTSMYDTFCNNDDALAFIIGHEMAHILLGHQQRQAKMYDKYQRAKKVARSKNSGAEVIPAAVQIRRYLIESKNMEYAADVEGAKLALKAGYNLDSAFDAISFINSLPQYLTESQSDHPDGEHRIQNYNENRKYFLDEEWQDMGQYNIYNSEVLPVNLSSDRKSFVINTVKENDGQYYTPETSEEIYLRFGYKYYLNREFDKSVKYFKDYFKINNQNAFAYLYASYAYEQLYKTKKNEKYLESAKEAVQTALKLEPKNKYIKEQAEALN